MKKIVFCALSTLLLFVLAPYQSKAGSESIVVSSAEIKAANEEKACVLLDRLSEIDVMDKSDMSFSEKRKLRKEVRSINGELKTLDGGVYLSVGAIIIILLLLILLL